MHEMSVNRVASCGDGCFDARVVGAGRSSGSVLMILGSDLVVFQEIVVFLSADQGSRISQAHESSS